jgi:hypothetical protein
MEIFYGHNCIADMQAPYQRNFESVVGSQSGNDISCQMTPLKPPQVQQQAIQAQLNYFLGADEYDRLFAGFEILHIKNKVLTLSVRPACTNEVRDKYSWHIAIVAEALLRQAIRKVNVVPFESERRPI